MPINFRISALVPVGMVVESVAQLDDSIFVTARAGIQVASCPLCGSPSRRVHSWYVREVSDLPCSGRSVRLRVVIRRYRCDAQHCRRRIFELNGKRFRRKFGTRSGELSEREVARMMTLEIRHELKRSPYSPVAGFGGPIPYPKGF